METYSRGDCHQGMMEQFMHTYLAKYPWRRHILCIAPLLGMYLLVTIFIGNEDAVEAFFLAHSEAHPFFTEVVEEITSFGNIGFYFAYAVLLALGLHRKKRTLVRFVVSYLIALAATVLLVEVAKYIVGRPRPLTDGEFDFFTSKRGWQSFPSGHVTESVVTVAPLAMRYGDIFIPFMFGLVPAIMGITRLYISQHHPSDFLGSALFGSIGVFLCWLVSGGVRCRAAVETTS